METSNSTPQIAPIMMLIQAIAAIGVASATETMTMPILPKMVPPALYKADADPLSFSSCFNTK